MKTGKIKKRNRNVKAWAARFLIFTFLVGLLTSFHAADVQAATSASKSNKALSMKVSFNGETHAKGTVSDETWSTNTYMLSAAYKKDVKVQKGMKSTQTLYLPASLFKKKGDEVCLSLYLDIKTTKGKEVGKLWGMESYTVRKGSKNVELYKNGTDGKEKKVQTVKKSGKYYKVTIKNQSYQSYIWSDAGKGTKVAKYNKKAQVAQGFYITGLCTKSKNVTVYADDLSLKSDATYKITFDKKDYRNLWGWYCKGNGKKCKVSVAAVK